MKSKDAGRVFDISAKKWPITKFFLFYWIGPDTYIGSIERLTAPMYVLSSEEQHKIIQKEITFTPGLYKIFDEIVVNAADNKQRDGNMDRLDITIDAENNWISVRNNGEGIPIEFHKKEKMYVPTLIFGHLLTGSNFDDGERKTTGGRNGCVNLVDYLKGKAVLQSPTHGKLSIFVE